MGFLKRYKWIIGGVGVVILVLGFLAFRPDKLFVDDVANESLSDAFATPTADSAVSEDEMTDEVTTGASMSDDEMTDDGTSDASMSDDEMTDDSMTDASTSGDETTDDEMTDETTSTRSPEPVAIATGAWEGLAHPASGMASIYELDGQYVLRFEDDTEIFNGPDLYVWLLEGDGFDGGTPGAHIDLGTIKGNIGGQNYDLPPDYDPDVHRTVLIWCLRFSVGFATADLV